MRGGSSTFVRLRAVNCGCASFHLWFIQICWDLQIFLVAVCRCWVGWIGSWLSSSSNMVWFIATELDNFFKNGSLSLMLWANCVCTDSLACWRLNEFKHHYKKFDFIVYRIIRFFFAIWFRTRVRVYCWCAAECFEL